MKNRILMNLENEVARLESLLSDIKNSLLQVCSQEKSEENMLIIRDLLEERARIEYDLSSINIELAALKKQAVDSRSFTIKMGSKIRKVFVVPPQVADPISGLISSNSPLGLALYSGRKGDTIKYETPLGVKLCTVLSIGF